MTEPGRTISEISVIVGLALTCLLGFTIWSIWAPTAHNNSERAARFARRCAEVGFNTAQCRFFVDGAGPEEHNEVLP
jgi:hypothetical protein